jgi:hypothetical protein
MGADNSTDSCDLFITLVHGTWARGCFPPLREKGRWFADGSVFRKNLTGALSKHGLSFCMCPFLWSGSNSVRERDKAARELAEHVRAKQVDYPGSTQVLIAHSHGGNVALRAVDKLELTQDGNVFIATIATPFVEILQAKLSPNAYFWLFFSAMTPFILLLKFVEKTLGIPGFISSPILVALSFLLYRAVRIKVAELVKLTSLSPSVRKHPLLILRAVDDEASLSLAAAAIGNRLSAVIGLCSNLIFVATLILFLPVILVALFSVAGEFFDWKFLEDFDKTFGEYFDWAIESSGGVVVKAFGWGLYGAGVSAFVALVLAPGICKSFFGRELLFNYLGCNINSQSAPDSIDRQSEFHFGSEGSSWGMVVTLADEGRRGLRHCLYNDPQCVERIAAWLAASPACRSPRQAR